MENYNCNNDDEDDDDSKIVFHSKRKNIKKDAENANREQNGCYEQACNLIFIKIDAR